MERADAGAVARVVASARAERAIAHHLAEPPRALGAGRLDALRLRTTLQPLANHEASQERHVLAGGLPIRPLYAALQLARPAQMASVLGAARRRAMASLLRRDPGGS